MCWQTIFWCTAMQISQLTRTVFCFQMICQLRLSNTRSPKNGNNIFPGCVACYSLTKHCPETVPRTSKFSMDPIQWIFPHTKFFSYCSPFLLHYFQFFHSSRHWQQIWRKISQTAMYYSVLITKLLPLLLCCLSWQTIAIMASKDDPRPL